jgi:hypothetical protein
VKVHNIRVGKKSVRRDGKSEKGWAGRVEFVGNALENINITIVPVIYYRYVKAKFVRI